MNGERLRVELMKRGLDQGSFAELAGVSPQTVSAACQGKPVNPTTFSKIVTALLRTEPIRGVEKLDLLADVNPANEKTIAGQSGDRHGGQHASASRRRTV